MTTDRDIRFPCTDPSLVSASHSSSFSPFFRWNHLWIMIYLWLDSGLVEGGNNMLCMNSSFHSSKCLEPADVTTTVTFKIESCYFISVVDPFFEKTISAFLVCFVAWQRTLKLSIFSAIFCCYEKFLFPPSYRDLLWQFPFAKIFLRLLARLLWWIRIHR